MNVTLVSIFYHNHHHILTFIIRACLPEAGLEVPGHVVPKIIAANGTHKHIEGLYNL